MESQETILQLDNFFSHWSIKLPMKFFAPIMRYRCYVVKMGEEGVLLFYTSVSNPFKVHQSIRVKSSEWVRFSGLWW